MAGKIGLAIHQKNHEGRWNSAGIIWLFLAVET
jgi:hypothetical protein